MCLSIPARIIKIDHEGSMLMAHVDFGGVSKEICLDYVPEAQVGQYVLIHVGFAISLLDEEEAMARLELIREVAQFQDGLDADGG